MNKSDSDNEQKKIADREKFKKATLLDTSVLTVKKRPARKIDLRSPDEQAGKWVRDPDEVREQRRAARRLRAKKNKKEE
jgi:hypothetical protein